MKTRITMRAALALGLYAVARGLGRIRRIRCALLRDAGHETRWGNIITATIPVALYLVVC